MPMIEMREALNQALKEEMTRDEKVFILGEEVAEFNGAYKVTKGLLDHFGPKRVIDTPISESGFTGLAVGAAMMGLRPVVEFMSFNFSLVAIDQIISNAAKMYYMSGGLYNIPMVMRGPNGAGPRVSSQHSHNMESVFAHFPGLHVMSPSTPSDAKGMLKAAIRCNDPVVFLENELAYNLREEVPEGEYLIPIGKGDIKREGTDVTIIAWSRMMSLAKTAAEELAKEGINVELLDPRTLKPLDMPLIARSVKKTNRVVVVEEGHFFSSLGAQVAESVYTDLFDYLDSPIARVCQSENPMPYAANLEAATLPSVDKIIKAVKQVTYRN
ncbi:MAG TPA: pyruvate dehydrogenase complex E1 component subunit beta [Fibrobacteria bacterium]|nr:pyruvate dehydrogenase complex E1 component subunit beta [Fibrobacteria bacterium]